MIDVNVADDQIERIIINEGDTPRSLSSEFAKKHGF